MDYKKAAAETIKYIGGKDNIVSAAHCATRLRLVIADNSKANKEALEDVEGVKGVFESSGQLQIIFGTGTVNKVYDEFIAQSGATAASKEDVKAAAVAKQNPIQRVVKTLGDVFVPILPAIVATGLMMGLVEALGNALPAFADSDWYGILDMISNTAFVYLPILIAISSARVFGGNIFLGALIGMVMIHSNLVNAWAVSGMDAADIPVWHLLGGLINIRQVGYQGHVIPVIIAVFIMSKMETWLHKKTPEVLDLFVVPLVSVVVTSFVTLIVIGPIFATLESWVLSGAEALVAIPYGIGALVMGILYPLTVVCGLHHMYNIIELGMLSNTGFNMWMPIASAANFAQCAACIAVAVKTRQNKTRALAIPAALSASLGITEPAIFGVNLRFMKPFISAMIGGGVAAAVGTFLGVKATANGVTGIPGFLITTNCPIQYAIMLLVAFGVTFAICFSIYHDEEKKPAAATATTGAAAPAAPVFAVPTEKDGALDIVAPMAGKAVTLADTGDATFAAEVLGKGAAIEPAEGKLYAPFDATVATVMGHAVGLEGKNGVEMLIHIGIDTVQLEGKHYTSHVEEGQEVKAGDLLMEFDIPAIQAEGYKTVTPVIVTNSDDYADIVTYPGADVSVGAKLITVKK